MQYIEIKDKILKGFDINQLSINYKYVPLISQQIIMENIKTVCLKPQENGLVKMDYILKNLFTFLYISANFSDIEYPDELYDNERNINISLAFEIYDFFMKNRLVERMYNQIDCKEFICLLENELEQEIEMNNNISNILSKTLNSIANKLPSEEGINSLINNIPSLLNSVDTGKAPKKRNSKKTKQV